LLEGEYQAVLIAKLKRIFPGCMVLKNDSGYRQGIPDLMVLFRDRWAMLEVKAYATAPLRPNQQYYVDWAAENSFGAFIYPENEEDILSALQEAFWA
jgi:hypothetical protein